LCFEDLFHSDTAFVFLFEGDALFNDISDITVDDGFRIGSAASL